jgi:hypothetical protein
MHHLITLLALTALLAPAAISCESAGDAAGIDAIRAQRAAFNAAIAAKDLETIAAVLHENVLLVTGTASEVFRGQAAQLALWQEGFAADEAVGGRAVRHRGLRRRLLPGGGRAGALREMGSE